MSTLLKRYQEVDAEIKALEALKKELRQEIGDLNLGVTTIDEDFYITVTENKRFDASLAKSLLTEDEYARVCKSVPDGTLVKRELGINTYEELRTVQGQVWTIKERND